MGGPWHPTPSIQVPVKVGLLNSAILGAEMFLYVFVCILTFVFKTYLGQPMHSLDFLLIDSTVR